MNYGMSLWQWDPVLVCGLDTVGLVSLSYGVFRSLAALVARRKTSIVPILFQNKIKKKKFL